MISRYFFYLVLSATATWAFSVSTSTPSLSVPEYQGADLKCSYTADFRTPRVEWKFKDLQGSQVFVVFDNNPTENYKSRVQLYKDGLMLKEVTRRDTGEYFCEVSSGDIYRSAVINLTVEVPSAVPICGVPSSVTTGSYVVLTCYDPDGSPPSTYKWFKDEALLPENPNMFQDFKNFSYILNPKEGTLAFPSVTKADTGRYYCMASNGIGPVQSCAAQMMAVRDVNVGAIVGGVIVALLLVLLLGLGLWFAFQKGHFSGKGDGKYKAGHIGPVERTVDREDDVDFKQKSSFVV
ncbi:junctional adhesion molecule A-like isoform X2 [Brienomyrus brachyistius]|uniref:junctional adhesion molecule A-like isoform X2 n=1 Tax=Brienomyrus brachyistius TaxID=42636 RepID=UPI0020B382DF|nr:junctional adhesion molecule A-like isoform X2 [Brienomyrus brachyistius]